MGQDQASFLPSSQLLGKFKTLGSAGESAPWKVSMKQARQPWSLVSGMHSRGEKRSHPETPPNITAGQASWRLCSNQTLSYFPSLLFAFPFLAERKVSKHTSPLPPRRVPHSCRPR